MRQDDNRAEGDCQEEDGVDVVDEVDAVDEEGETGPVSAARRLSSFYMQQITTARRIPPPKKA